MLLLWLCMYVCMIYASLCVWIQCFQQGVWDGYGIVMSFGLHQCVRLCQLMSGAPGSTCLQATTLDLRYYYETIVEDTYLMFVYDMPSDYYVGLYSGSAWVVSAARLRAAVSIFSWLCIHIFFNFRRGKTNVIEWHSFFRAITVCIEKVVDLPCDQ